MKTINENVQMFKSLKKATQLFNNIESGHLLSAKFANTEVYFVDKAKECLKQWPTKYTLIKEK